MSNNADQPAYPVIKTDQEQTSYNQENYVYGKTYSTGGLSKRELIAAMAMQGLLANHSISDDVVRMVESGEYNFKYGKETFAEMAIQAADALLSQLEKDKL